VAIRATFLFFTGVVILRFIVVNFCYEESKRFSLEELQNELGIV